MFKSKVSRYFYEQRKRQLRRLEERLGKGLTRELSVEELLLDPEAENGLLKKLVWPLYLEVGETAGQALIAELGADPGIFTLVDTPAMAALSTKLIKVVGINETIREQLRGSLLEGMGQMETTAVRAFKPRTFFFFVSLPPFIDYQSLFAKVR